MQREIAMALLEFTDRTEIKGDEAERMTACRLALREIAYAKPSEVPNEEKEDGNTKQHSDQA